MAISNGSTITAADINAMLSTALGDVSDDDAQLPLGCELNLNFPGPNTTAILRRFTLIAPCDLLVEVAAVQAADLTAASTVTVTITGDGGLINWPITVGPFATGSGVVAGPRILFDNAKTNVSKDFATTAAAFRVFPKGSTIIISAATTSAAPLGTLQVCLVLREFFDRES